MKTITLALFLLSFGMSAQGRGEIYSWKLESRTVLPHSQINAKMECGDITTKIVQRIYTTHDKVRGDMYKINTNLVIIAKSKEVSDCYGEKEWLGYENMVQISKSQSLENMKKIESDKAYKMLIFIQQGGEDGRIVREEMTD